MKDDHGLDRSLEALVTRYFPRDAVQVLEDVRAAGHQAVTIADAEANVLLGALVAR